MSVKCNQGISTPTLILDECNGTTVNAKCLIDSTLYPELNLDVNSSQQEINQALYLALVNLKNQIESL